jgi:hypothetical protein
MRPNHVIHSALAHFRNLIRRLQDQAVEQTDALDHEGAEASLAVIHDAEIVEEVLCWALGEPYPEYAAKWSAHLGESTEEPDSGEISPSDN